VFFRPRFTTTSDAATSTRKGVPYFAAAWLAAMVTGLWKPDIGRDALLVHLLDFGHADFDLGLAVAQQGLELGAAHRLDAARLVDVLDRHGAAQPALLAVIGDEAGHRMDQADLHRRRLRAHDRGKAQAAGGERRRAGHEAAPRNGFSDMLFHCEASY
jgi:hypothetical protein